MKTNECGPDIRFASIDRMFDSYNVEVGRNCLICEEFVPMREGLICKRCRQVLKKIVEDAEEIE